MSLVITRDRDSFCDAVKRYFKKHHPTYLGSCIITDTKGRPSSAIPKGRWGSGSFTFAIIYNTDDDVPDLKYYRAEYQAAERWLRDPDFKVLAKSRLDLTQGLSIPVLVQTAKDLLSIAPDNREGYKPLIGLAFNCLLLDKITYPRYLVVDTRGTAPSLIIGER